MSSSNHPFPLKAAGAGSPARGAVVSTKISPPGSAGTVVRRSALADSIAARDSARVVLVRAPAGFGKTMVMLQGYELLRSSGMATGWVNLDAADNDVPRFISVLSECVREMHIGDDALPSSGLDALEILTRSSMPFALFLDDLEGVQSPAVLGLIREIIERLPRGGKLVIGSRSLPDLGLGRLRARGQMVEIDANALRFTLDEADQYLRLRGHANLPPEAVTQLHGKTEGWITALWLASVVLQRHRDDSRFIDRFSGSSQAIAEYLADDVLVNQPADVREFLLRTSILRHLSAPLCQALIPGIDAAAMLERLISENVFLSPIESDDRAYRYHSLFSAFLRSQLIRQYPGEIQRLHLAASKWFESAGRPVPAIDHAIEAHDFERALTLLDESAERFLEEGRMRLLARWFEALGPQQVARFPWMQLVAVWALCFTHGPVQALERLEASRLTESRDPRVQDHVGALRPLLLAMMDRYDEAYEVGQASLGRPLPPQPFASSVLSNAMAHIVAVMGQHREAHRLLDQARRTHTGSLFNRMYTESIEGMLDLEQGRLRHAMARFRIAVSAAPPSSRAYRPTGGNAWAGVLYAQALYETNDIESAGSLLNVYLPLARDAGLPDHMIMGHVMRSRLNFHRGDVDASLRVLTELEYLGHQRTLARVVVSAKLERSRLLLLQGNAAGARDEMERADDPVIWQRVARQHLPAHFVDDLQMARLRWDVHFGDPVLAALEIERAHREAVSSQRLYRALKLMALRAMALWRQGAKEEVASHLLEAMGMASRDGFVRLFLDEGSAMAGPVHQVCMHTQDNPGGVDPILADYLRNMSTLLVPATSAAIDAPSHLESLTQKELRILRLLAEGYANSAMAEKLFVSDSTVRTHLRNINAKLGAGNRTQAVAIARRHGLIR